MQVVQRREIAAVGSVEYPWVHIYDVSGLGDIVRGCLCRTSVRLKSSVAGSSYEEGDLTYTSMWLRRVRLRGVIGLSDFHAWGLMKIVKIFLVQVS